MTDKTKNIKAQLAKLDDMNGKALAAKFEELYCFSPGETTPLHLRARLAYRIQEIFLGGMSESDKAVLERIAANDPLANLKPPKGSGRIPQMPGTQFRRVWKDREYIVTVGDDEFHLAFKVDDFDAAHKLHEEMGCICFENPDMGIYFCEDPDHYWLEVLPCRNQGKDS